jgi:hypothetical protein
VRTHKPLRQAVYNGASFDVLSCLVKELSADVNGRDKDGWTSLTLAVYLDHHDTVHYLAEVLGADVNIPNKLGQTPLYLAAARGQLAFMRVLLKLGADINQTCTLGSTPLMAASGKKHADVVKWLVKAVFYNYPDFTAAGLSRAIEASPEQTAYLEAKTHCSSPGCSGAGIMKCTGCKQARYCGEACQLAHWKAHKADCRRWSAELAAGKGH